MSSKLEKKVAKLYSDSQNAKRIVHGFSARCFCYKTCLLFNIDLTVALVPILLHCINTTDFVSEFVDFNNWGIH